MLHVQTFTFNPFQENTYVVFQEKGDAIIIDPGCYGNQEEKMLFDFIQNQELQVVQLINTHCHLDHVFGNKSVSEKFGLELFLHPNEEQLLAFAPQSGKGYGVPFENYQGSLHFLQEGDIVTVGDAQLQVLLTPGHSPGSICLYSKDDGFVIAGDVLFRDSIGRTDLPGGNHQALLTSVREKLFTLPRNVKVYPGHGPATTIGYEMDNNPFFQ